MGSSLGQGKALGLRKVDATRSRWIAKFRNESGHHSRVLGDLSVEFDFERAREAALAWCKSYASGITDSTYTVEQACRAHSDWDGLVRTAAEKAGLPAGVCLYTLRHSFITQALMDGMSTLDVARITGASLAMIEKHYGHLVMREARERLDQVRLL